MDSSNGFWQPIRHSLSIARKQSLFVLVLAVLVLPIIESLLTESWSSAPPDAKSVVGWVLFLVVIIHLALGAILLIEQINSQPNVVLARAFEVEENGKNSQRELERRRTAYQLLRETFDRLNVETCNIQFSSDEKMWCRGGFHKCLSPILQPFIDKAAIALGIVTNSFTLEVYFEPDIVPLNGKSEIGINGLCQHYFYGMNVNRCVAVRMPSNCSPARQCMNAESAFEHHVENSKHLYFANDKLRPNIYFRRYAACPIIETCSNDPVGAIVLTSQQDSEFADDVLEVLAFLRTCFKNQDWWFASLLDMSAIMVRWIMASPCSGFRS